MARKDRTGNRTSRDQRKTRRVPEMGYYLVVTDTEATERCYFTGLHRSLPPQIQPKLVIKVIETKTQDMIQKCLELTAYIEATNPVLLMLNEVRYDNNSSCN